MGGKDSKLSYISHEEALRRGNVFVNELMTNEHGFQNVKNSGVVDTEI